jgi:hypothetical protein
MDVLELVFVMTTGAATIVFIVALHISIAPAASGFGEHVSPVTCSGWMFRVTDCPGLAAAVIVTAVAAAVAAAEAVKFPESAPSAIDMVDGTVTVGALDVNVTTLPPAGAAAVRVTVQAVLAPAIRLDEAQTTLLTPDTGDSVTAATFARPPSEAVS